METFSALLALCAGNSPVTGEFLAQRPVTRPHWWLSHPGYLGEWLFLVHFRRRHSASTFQLTGKTPEANSLKPHMVNLWVWETILAPISPTLGQGHQTTKAGQNLTGPHDKVRTDHPIATKLGKCIPPPTCVAYHLIKFWRNSVWNFFFNKFFVKLQIHFKFPQSNILFAISEEWLVQWMWNNKQMTQLDAMLTWVPLTLTFDLEFSRSNCISGMGGPIVIIVMEWKGRELIECPIVMEQKGQELIP